MTNLSRILKDLPDSDVSGDQNLEIKGVAYDSREVKPGYLFVALRGHQLDGHDYIQEAVRKGAVAVVAERFEAIEGQVTKVKVDDSRRALSKVAVRFYTSPFNAMNLIGITGTNGKTTISYLLESILETAGAKPGVLGTIAYRFSGNTRPAPVTTPESLDVMRLMREMADGGATDVIMEVSSHALDQGRVQDCPFRVGIFTNLSRDHLDYHKTMEAYFTAKSRLFVGLGVGRQGYGPHAIINVDDPYGRRLVSMTKARVWTYGLDAKCQVRGELISADRTGIRVRLVTPAGSIVTKSSLMGHFNSYNIVAAAAAGLALNVSLETIAEGVARLKVVPGRLEVVQNRRSLTLVVDYSHTPDALLKAMEALKPYAEGRLITIFGCGGDRDRGKRYDMGLLAGKHSDLVFITSDNPRSEDPLSIVKEIETGTKKAGLKLLAWPVSHNHISRGYFLEVDRRAAIRKAVSLADPKDVVLIAGKGHEDYQIIGKEKRHFDDREEAAQAALERP
jgi:UDP-N-acetylmuramoyl-L-alanyl-D-glutamate--2,6-diaminopimelate ligase